MTSIDLESVDVDNQTLGLVQPPICPPTKIADLFSTFIHLLTFIAFNVHALMGCCVHHNHALPIGGHDEIGCHHSLEHGHGRSAANDEISHLDQSVSGFVLDLQHHDGRPCDHSQPCDEGRCVFVDVRLVSCQLDFHTSVSLAYGMSLPIAQPCVGPAIDSYAGSKPRVMAAVQRCALLQSWQI